MWVLIFFLTVFYIFISSLSQKSRVGSLESNLVKRPSIDSGINMADAFRSSSAIDKSESSSSARWDIYVLCTYRCVYLHIYVRSEYDFIHLIMTDLKSNNHNKKEGSIFLVHLGKFPAIF